MVSKRDLKQLSKNDLIRLVLELLPLKDKVKELEARLLAYENAHTPPSKSKKRRPKKPSGKKLGAKKGHPKWERPEPEPTGSVKYDEDACPNCSAALGDPVRVERFLEEEIPEPQPVEVIEHLVCHYECSECNKHVVARNKAPSGRFGKNLETHVALLKFEDRLPLRKVTGALERHYGITISNPGILNITKRVAKKLRTSYRMIIQRIRRDDAIYVDETEIKVDGITHHLWTFVTEIDILFVIRRSRGSNVLKEVLGQYYDGTICCDGWTAYKTYSNNLQRCWAHLLREAEAFAEKYTEAKGFYISIKKLFGKLKEVLEKPPPLNHRKKLKQSMTLQLQQIASQMASYKQLKKFAGKILNGLDYWFTCIVKPNVEPTNNTAEQALRELIVQRKIIGGLRRKKGAFIMETINSIIASAKRKGHPTFSTIKAAL